MAGNALSFADALNAVLAAASPLPVERVELVEAIGRALAESIVSPLSLPPWDNSGMDGYAVRRADVKMSGVSTPQTLQVIGTIAAGADASSLPTVGERQSARIMTGAPIPPGADAVIRVEDTDGGLDRVIIRDARDTVGRANIRPRGEDVKTGAVVLERGTTIGPSQLGLLASIGCASVLVHRRPRVTVLCSGDELVLLDQFSEALSGRRIVSSSSYAIPALLRAAGADVTVAPLVPDTLADMTTAIETALASGCDALVTTGGVSVGALDFTRAALTALGGTLNFWRSRIRPGGPIGTGNIRGALWIGLPGNPVSSMVTGTLFAWPVIRRMGGHARVDHVSFPVFAADAYETPAPLTYFLRVALERRDDGEYLARLAGPQGSNLMRPIALADALMIVPEHRSSVSPGDRLFAVLLP